MVALAGSAGAQGVAGKIPTFEPPVEFAAGNFPWGIDAADALGAEGGAPDGYPEIAVAVGQLNIYNGFAGYWTGNTGEVWVYRNTGLWTNPSNGLQLLMPTIKLNLIHPNTIAADVKWADMDNDGRQDLVVTGTTHFDGSSADGAWGIYIFRYSAATDSFVFHDYEPTEYPLRGLAVEDFDNDGDMDVAAAVDLIDISPNRGYISVAKNDGTGMLLPDTLYGLGSGDEATMEVASGLFDKTPGGATLPDLFTSRWGLGDGISLTNLDGTNYAATIVSACPAWSFTDLGVARFTSGKLSDDIVAMAGDGFLYVLQGNANGAFNIDCGSEPNDRYFDGSGGGPFTFLPRGLAVGQLNGGTKPDVVVAPGDPAAVGSEIIMLLGKGSGDLAYSSTNSAYHIALGPTADRPLRVVLADLNQDGFDDIITSNHGDAQGDPGTITVLINKLVVSTTP